MKGQEQLDLWLDLCLPSPGGSRKLLQCLMRLKKPGRLFEKRPLRRTYTNLSILSTTSQGVWRGSFGWAAAGTKVARLQKQRTKDRSTGRWGPNPVPNEWNSIEIRRSCRTR